jgi:hypothetical protein
MALAQNSNGMWTDTPATGAGGQRLNDNFIELGIRAPKRNFAATVDPTVTDDSTSEYAVGSIWHNNATGQIWFCFDASVGAALWQTPNFLNGNKVTVENGSGQVDFLTSTGLTLQALGNPTGASFITLNNSTFSPATFYIKCLLGTDDVFHIDGSGSVEIGKDSAANLTVHGVVSGASGTFTGVVSANTPSSSNHLTTKAYVDGLVQGLKIKPTATVATTAALPANTYSSGILTATANGALTVDGHVVVNGESILVKDEATAANNGLYTQTQLGTGSVPYKLTRDTSMDVASEMSAALIPVGPIGTFNANSFWLSNPTSPVTLGTTAIPFVQYGRLERLVKGCEVYNPIVTGLVGEFVAPYDCKIVKARIISLDATVGSIQFEVKARSLANYATGGTSLGTVDLTSATTVESSLSWTNVNEGDYLAMFVNSVTNLLTARLELTLLRI